MAGRQKLDFHLVTGLQGNASVDGHAPFTDFGSTSGHSRLEDPVGGGDAQWQIDDVSAPAALVRGGKHAGWTEGSRRAGLLQITKVQVGSGAGPLGSGGRNGNWFQGGWLSLPQIVPEELLQLGHHRPPSRAAASGQALP